MGVQSIKYSTIQQYLEWEYKSETKHEYEQGTILAMTGGSINPGTLCGNILPEIRMGLTPKNSNCNAFGSEIRIHIEKTDSIVYPDAMVICGEMEVSKEDKEAVINPVLIVEVLSTSTESYDRGDKFYKYRQLPSLREYILIDQNKPVVETFFKKEPTIWEIARFSGLDETIILKSLDLHISMKELYLTINFPTT
jgi:Uma2 family endonuclease